MIAHAMGCAFVVIVNGAEMSQAHGQVRDSQDPLRRFLMCLTAP